MDNFGVNMLVALLLPTAAWSWWGALRSPRRRCVRADRRSIREFDQRRKALR